MRVKQSNRWAAIGMLLASSVLVASACGSSDTKKKPGPRFQDGGESSGGGSGEPTEGGRSEPGEGGSSTTEAGAAQGANAGSAQGGMTNVAGESGSSGGAGGIAGDTCPAGTADCDDDPSTCEDVNNKLQCGSCEVSCSDESGVSACQDGLCVMTSCTSGFGDCDVDGTNGCEESLAANDAHCGSCTRDCAAAGSTCASSRCAAIELRNNAFGFATVLAHQNVYLGHAGSGVWTIDRIPLDKSGRFSVWSGNATGNFPEGALFADDTRIYWAVGGTPSSVLSKEATDAADALPDVLFQPTQQPMFLREQGANFYWAANSTGFIYARSKTAPFENAGVAIMSVDQGNYTAFATTPTTLYWIGSQNGPELRMVPIGGGEPLAVPGAVVNPNNPLWVVGEKLYFARSVLTNALNGVYSYTAGDLAPTQLVATNSIYALIVDDTGIYYKVVGQPFLYKAPLAGGAGVAIASGVGGGLFAGIDDTFVYQIGPWTSGGDAQMLLK